MDIKKFQMQIGSLYYDKDSKRGVEKTFMWFVEEVGELSRAIKENDKKAMEEEFADVFAWLASAANLCGIELENAVAEKYGKGCPKCKNSPCICK